MQRERITAQRPVRLPSQALTRSKSTSALHRFKDGSAAVHSAAELSHSGRCKGGRRALLRRQPAARRWRPSQETDRSPQGRGRQAQSRFDDRLVRFPGVRPAPKGVSLVEEHYPIGSRVEESSPPAVGSSSRPSVEHERGLAIWIPDLPAVDAVAVAHGQPAVAILFGVGIKTSQGPRLLFSGPVARNLAGD
jgi:hypothetical protein